MSLYCDFIKSNLGERMAIFEGTLGIGIAFLLAVALAQYAKFKAEKGMTWLGVAGVFFLFSGAFAAGAVTQNLASVQVVLQPIFELLGWLFALIAAVFVAYETLLER
jgi:hypothetical protein